MVDGRQSDDERDTKIVGQDDSHISFSALKGWGDRQVHGTTQRT